MRRFYQHGWLFYRQVPFPHFARSLFLALLLPTCALTPMESPSSAAPLLSCPIPILPSLSGFGTSTVAGSGRHLRPPRAQIFTVLSLADSGPHTLRECLEATAPRTCIFGVGGEISLSRAIRIRSPYLTIAGQTAPDPGIILTHSGIKVETHDVLIQHLTVRPGDGLTGASPEERDGISIGAPSPGSAHNIVIDHVSLTSAIDENLSTAYATTHDVTVTHSIIAEGLHLSRHPKGPHSKGVLIGDGSKRITLRRNLLAFNEERNPYLKPGTSVEFVNNVVYGWGQNGAWSLCNLTNNTDTNDPILLTFIGNVYRPGPRSFQAPPVYAKKLARESQIFAHDTIGPGSESPYHLDHGATLLPHDRYLSSAPPLLSTADTPLPSAEVWSTVLSSAGSRPRRPNAHDARIIHEVLTDSGEIKDCSTGCPNNTGRETIGTSFHLLSPPEFPFKDTNGDGYTDLENWLNWYAILIEKGWSGNGTTYAFSLNQVLNSRIPSSKEVCGE